MRAITFFKEFQDIFEEEHLAAERAYRSNTAFTTFITQKINKLLTQKGSKKQNEYLRIDAIQWTAKANLIDKPDDIHLNKHLWDLEIAVEHENNPKDWMDEVVKLAHIVCPLRVVIGYMPWNKRNEDQRYLNYVSRWLQELLCKDNMQRGEFLIILGNSHTDGKVERFYNYKGYLFNPKEFCFEPLQ